MKCAQTISYRVVVALLLATMAIGFVACNPNKKNTAAARRYTAFITKYNIYYNGDRHIKETLHDMEEKYEDDYTRMLFMHPVEAKNDKKAPQPSGDFKRSIEKAQKAIQVRSIKKRPERKSGKNDPAYKEWLKRDEYNPVMQDSWMMLAQSQYYNGDFLGAASTFHYITNHFTWLPAVVTSARLWQARSYLAMDWLYEAEALMDRVKPDQLTNKDLEYLYNFVYADYNIRQHDYAKAAPYLQKALKYSSGAQSTRLRFLLGQVYEASGDKQAAYEAFKKVSASNSASYRTKFNARIKMSEVYTGTNIEPEVKSLRAMVKYDRNKEYLDQIYYAIGNLYLSRGDTLQAQKNYELAVEKSTRNGIDKALAQVVLGGLYYEQGNYEKAQPCYSEAIPQLPETFKNYKLLKNRSDVLDELAVYSQNVNLNDSLLHLASLPEAEYLKIIDKIIEDLKKKEKEEADAARRQEYDSKMAGRPGMQDANQREFNINTDDSWYFYNTTTRNSGRTEFQKRWGSRKLEDDWRRRNKAVFNTSDFDADSDSDSETASGDEAANDSIAGPSDEEIAAANDPHNREYYLKQIPFTDEEKANSHEIIQEGLYNMGVILKDKLDDTPSAAKEFGRLLTDYPDNTHRLDVYYNLYLMYMRAGETDKAEQYRQLILSDFADSPYGQALLDPDYIEHLKLMDVMERRLYDDAFEAYSDNRNADVHSIAATMKTDYPLSKLMPRFMFLDALAYVTEKRPDKFNETLREMLERYPDTDLSPYASSWLKGMAQGRELQTASDGRNMRGMLWDIHLGGDSTTVAGDSIAPFTIDPDAPQLLVLVYPTDRVSGNALLYEVARHNFKSFDIRDFDLEPMKVGRLGMLIIKGFKNQRELNRYRSMMAASEDFSLPRDVEPIAISEHNFDIMLSQNRSFDEYFRFLDEQNYEDPQRGILQPDQIETLEEAEDREQENSEQGIVNSEQENSEQGIVNSEQVKEEVPADSVPAASPAPAPEQKAAEKPEQKAEQKAAEKPEQKTEQKATQKPEQKTAQKPTQKPTQTPAVITGSEGDDDPLLSP